MEGAGLYVACQDQKVDWMLVKGICDWADGHKAEDKEARQQTAAHNATAFVLHALQFATVNWEERRRQVAEQAQVATSSGAGAVAAAFQRYSWERVHQFGGEKAPPKAVASSLPAQPYFFGREKELATIREAISPEARTWGALIDGPGGIGKTALAMRAGHLAPPEHFERKIFLSAKMRELTPAGEQPLEDFMLPNYMALLSELGCELGLDTIAQSDPNQRANLVRRALADRRALIVIDNVETFPEAERVRLYQFLSRLPETCKAIVTSRRRTDIDARGWCGWIAWSARMRSSCWAELAKNNRHLQRATTAERSALYEITNGNPLLIKWAIGQLGREGSQCRSIPQVISFLQAVPPHNDPLEYIFGDLLDTFSESETAALAALAHFTQPARVKWIAMVAGIPEPAAQTALEDLSDRALLVSDAAAQSFLLPRLAAVFLRRKRPESIAQAGGRLSDRVFALVLENGGDTNYERFPALEAAWAEIAAALPLLVQGENERLQRACDALKFFLNYSGRWDERLELSRQAEEKALAVHDYDNAGGGRLMRGGSIACAGRLPKCCGAPSAARRIGKSPLGRGRTRKP